MASLEADYRRRRRVAMLRRVRALPRHNAAGMDDQEALFRIDVAIEDGKAVGIVQDEDVLRLVALAFLPDTVRADPAVARVLTRVLCRVEWEPASRLDFLDAHVIRRTSDEFE